MLCQSVSHRPFGSLVRIQQKASALRSVAGLAALLLTAFVLPASAQTFSNGTNSITVNSAYGDSAD